MLKVNIKIWMNSNILQAKKKIDLKLSRIKKKKKLKSFNPLVSDFVNSQLILDRNNILTVKNC